MGKKALFASAMPSTKLGILTHDDCRQRHSVAMVPHMHTAEPGLELEPLSILALMAHTAQSLCGALQFLDCTGASMELCIEC